MLPEKGAPQKAKTPTTSWPLASTYAFMICSAKSPPWLEAHEAHWYERRTILDMRERKKVHVEFHQQKFIKDWYLINTFAFENKIIMRYQIRILFGQCLVMDQAQWAVRLRFYVYVLSAINSNAWKMLEFKLYHISWKLLCLYTQCNSNTRHASIHSIKKL